MFGPPIRRNTLCPVLVDCIGLLIVDWMFSNRLGVPFAPYILRGLGLHGKFLSRFTIVFLFNPSRTL
uniref:Uncharacterized protein n=1 Tax=Arundo donax TaxID=35708 RepID=A0A0A9BV17_ARUDO